MDLQMPAMGGLEATRTVRRMGLPGLPILALTANVSAGEEARCLEAGMDGYLSKPFRAQDLFEAVERWGRRGAREKAEPDAGETAEPDAGETTAPAAGAPAGASRPGAAAEAAPVDLGALLAALGGSQAEEVAREVLTLFVTDGRARLEALEEAARGSDAASCQRVAHAMRSGALGARAWRMAELLDEAEEAARAGEVAGVRERMPETREEHARIARFVERFLSR